MNEAPGAVLEHGGVDVAVVASLEPLAAARELVL